jgi:hypothetical protein
VILLDPLGWEAIVHRSVQACVRIYSISLLLCACSQLDPGDGGVIADAGIPDAGPLPACTRDTDCVLPGTCEGATRIGSDAMCVDGECRYEPNDVECPNGCEAGECVVVACVEGQPCDDGDACTTGDVCEGTCGGSPVVCGAPPPPECAGATLLTYEGPGVCARGSCGYDIVLTECAGGCEAGACVPPCEPITWSTVRIDSGGDWGGSTAITVDAAGVPHVAYHRAAYDRSYGGRELFYATPGPERWETSLIVTGNGNDLPNTTAIALDTAGAVHVVYPGLGDWSMHHATRAGGVWVSRSVGSGNSSAAMIAEGDVMHAVHTTTTSVDYAARSADGTWRNEHVGSGHCGSIAQSADGTLHVSYVAEIDRDHSALTYASRPRGGTWTSTVVDPLDYGIFGIGCDTDIDVDPGGGVHIVYIENRTTLYHAYLAPGGSWEIETVGSGGLTISMAIDARGGLHLSYGQPLHYVHRPPGGEWTMTQLDPVLPGADSSIAVDSTFGVHIAHYDSRRLPMFSAGIHYTHGRVCP